MQQLWQGAMLNICDTELALSQRKVSDMVRCKMLWQVLLQLTDRCMCTQFDAGSCIDGRLTSAWNWGSKIEKKEYYHIFKICGFVGMHQTL